MKRSQQDLDFSEQNPPQDDKRKRQETKLCTPFCNPEDCPSSKHNTWIKSLVNLQEPNQCKLIEWQASVTAEAKGSFDFNQPLVDPAFENESFSLLSWAAMLGKVKTVKWLLEQDFIVLFPITEDTANGRNVGSNSTALFSAVRYLHIGMITSLTHNIAKCFVKILHEFLNKDPEVLLVQEEGVNKGNTLLHLCAEGDEESSAPFLVYLKRTLEILRDLYPENHSSKEKLIKILEKKNYHGDTFLHLLAKYKGGQEAKEVDKIKENFRDIPDITGMKNNEGKTVDDILKEFRDVFKTGSQATECRPLIVEQGFHTTSLTDDRDLVHVDVVCLLGKENQGCSPLPMPVASTESPPRSFPASEPDNMSQSYAADNGNHFQDSQSVNRIQANPVESMNSSTNPEIIEAKEEVKESVRKLIRTTTLQLDQEKGKLEKMTRKLARCRSNVEKLEGDLAKCKNFLSQLQC